MLVDTLFVGLADSYQRVAREEREVVYDTFCHLTYAVLDEACVLVSVQDDIAFVTAF